MYKAKIVFLYKNSEDKCIWSHAWVDWNGTDDIEGIIAELREAEEKALKGDRMDEVVQYAVLVDCNDITEGKYQCGSCECFFEELDDESCPFCGSGNFVEGCIDG